MKKETDGKQGVEEAKEAAGPGKMEVIEMGYKIPREAWRIIEIKIRRYPENKKLYNEELENLIHRTQGNDGMPRGSATSNPTEDMAIKIAENPKLSRIKNEIESVESVYSEMIPEYQEVIRSRFWSYRNRNKSYLKMEVSTNYRERQMQRIVAKFVREVGRKLGEI